MSKKRSAPHARVDDMPALLAHLKKMGVAACVDQHGPTTGHWQGVSLGWTTVGWLACLLSEGDHRLYRVASWVPAPPGPRRGCLGRQGRPRDLAADRLATLLADLADAARWGALARALPPSVRRVDDVPGRLGRVDPTTAAASVTPAGLCQRGHSQDHRPELPPGPSAMAVLEPLGLPLTTPVVAGNTADAPRSLPESAQGCPRAGPPGLPSGGDGQRAAIGTPQADS